MENLKQLTIKIDPVTYDRINDLVKSYRWYKRNSLINTLLTNLLEYAPQADIYRLLSLWGHRNKKLKITIELVEE